VAEPSPLHVIVRDLADALGSERLPGQVLAAVPAAGRAGQALPCCVRVFLRLGPVTPGMALERVLSEWRQVRDELLADRVGERRGDADVVQRAVLVVEAEQERADHRAGAVRVPEEAGAQPGG